jgi:F-type H+-transporting ATPase subunit delta
MQERARAYAAAIFEVAQAEGYLDQVEDELFRFARVFESNDALRDTLINQSLPAERREAIVEDLLGRRALPLTTALVSFVVAAGRARELPEVIDSFVQRAAESRQRAVAEVRAAQPIEPDQLERLSRALSASLGKQIEVKVVVDPAVIGGVMATVGDTVIDGTVRHRLDQLKEALK